GSGSSKGFERELPYLVRKAAFFELFLCLTYGSYFRPGVHHPGNEVVIHVWLLSGQVFRHVNTFFLCLVCKHGTLNDITYSIYVFDIGLKMMVDFDPAFFVGFNACFFQSKSFGIWFSANSYQTVICFDLKG